MKEKSRKQYLFAAFEIGNWVGINADICEVFCYNTIYIKVCQVLRKKRNEDLKIWPTFGRQA